MGFFDAFTGKAQKRQIEEANRQATGYLNTGYGEAKNALTDGYQRAEGYMSPYVSEGRADQSMYRGAIGLRGQGGYDEAMAAYRANPFSQHQQDSTTNALLRRFGSAGMGDSGASRLAAARAVTDQGYNDWNNWLSRLQGQGQQGYGASQSMAGMSQQRGSQLADLGWGYNSALAGNAINKGNAMAQAEGIGWNNLFSAVGLGAKAYAGMK